MSDAVRRLVDLARASGMDPDEGQWSKAYVFRFDGLMPDDVRATGNADQSLDYFSYVGSPHDPPDEGFIDRAAKTAISFLRVKEA